MAVYNLSPKTFVAGEALAAYRRVKYSSSTVIYADANEAAVGVTLEPVASGENVSVHLFNAGGTVKLTASEALADGATLYGAADGKVTDTDGGSYTARFTALEAATADGDIIEVLPIVAN